MLDKDLLKIIAYMFMYALTVTGSLIFVYFFVYPLMDWVRGW